MTSSGTYTFNPGAGEIFLAALSMCGIRRTDITTEHLVDATFQANLQMGDLSNRNPNQWALETQSVALVSGAPTYNLATRTVLVAVAYIETTAGTVTTARVLGPISASEYAAIPNKAQQGFPNAYWVNLLTPTPTITLYFTPDSAYTYTLKLQTFRQMQDVNPASGETIDVPYRFLDAFVTGLAFRLAGIYAPERALGLKQLYDERFGLAAAEDQERVALYITPGISGYFR